MSEKQDTAAPANQGSVQFQADQPVPDRQVNRESLAGTDSTFADNENGNRHLNAATPLSKKDTQQSAAAISIMSDYDWSDEEEIPEEDEDSDEPREYVIPEELLQTDPTKGLTSAEVETRRKKYGLNQLSIESENKIVKFFMFFCGPIQYVMWVAACLAGGLQDWVDLGVIIGLLLLNAFVGFIQEYQAGNIIDQLKQTLALTAVAVRDGQEKDVEANTLVPGDIILVEDGTIVPADARVLGEDSRLQVDQSALTGESLAASKGPGDELFSSSAIKRGRAYAVVTAIGEKTFVGRAATLAGKASGGGHFTEVINGIGTVLLVLVVIWLLIIWISGFYRSTGIVKLLEYTLVITVVGVPVGLPAVVTTTMAVGAAFLAKKKAIVQKLTAIESLAGVEILCSDKTGTLTQNKLTLHDPYCVEGVDDEMLIFVSALAASRKKKGMDAIDKAVIKALGKYPQARMKMREYRIQEFQPFDPVSKKVVAKVIDPEGNKCIAVKGAPPFVLRMVQEESNLDPAIAQKYEEVVAEFADRGFRGLGIAWYTPANGWQILGILPLFDPPRYDTGKTIAEAQELGLKVKMLTGDAVGIAKETARQLRMGTNIYNADKLGMTQGGASGSGEMTGSELYDFVEAADGFAEVFPEHKYHAVDILQKRGYLVAMTGDGVNDAPSLKKADTGIAVEGSSDAARSAADIVFLAPGLGVIIDAIKTSRQIFHRMYAYIIYRIALSLHLEIFLTTAMVILDETINVELVVFIAIFADIATLMVAYDNAPFSATPVKWNLPKLWGLSVIMAIILAAGTWIIYTTTMVPGQGVIQNWGGAQQVMFLEVVLTENWLIFITRLNTSFFDSLPSWQLAGAVFVVDILASIFAIFGWFTGVDTDIVTVVRIWLFSFGVFCVMALVYMILSNSVPFDRIVHGKSPKAKKNRSLEDFMLEMARVSNRHEYQRVPKHESLTPSD
ncbi:plasma-membrane proton-e [Basidiobolus meristosporus CBS 931.73]|uniref:Plasma membrane ATPase n=1 Tax=Basidiobolus meristosporus CBS 931.73 TaxID=1314790 RepID=A0A1Y1VTR6_9FUNG|nr:plasma-membrane proton-e [Basidiobolus meristosporus CBS 931.73]ORX92668.1 plasma-membrane proton-e [Basidiobolus meristosporus CBS 931.73]|eukprot:ORX64691.1 plasma-membrane proton-e [Basidiobolus meristosporus CBS 931.73]